MKRALTLCINLILMLGFGSGATLAQTTLSRDYTITVPILNENLVQAQKTAISKAKKALLEELIAGWVHEELFESVQKRIEQKLLKQPDRFIAATRVAQEFTDEEAQELTLELGADVFRVRLLTALRALSIPLLDDPLQSMVLFYDPMDPLWNSQQRSELMRVLMPLLRPYNLQIQRLIPLPSPEMEWLGRSTTPPISAEYRAQIETDAFLLLDLQVQPAEGEFNFTPTLVARLALYHPEQGNLIFQHQVSQAVEDLFFEEGELQAFFDGFKPIRPQVWEALSQTQVSQNKTFIKLSGFPGPREEHPFIRHFFLQNPQWEAFQLYSLAAEEVVYQGRFQGSKKRFLESLKQPFSSNYHLQQVQWEDDWLEIDLQWLQRLFRLEPFQPVKLVDEWFNGLKLEQRQEVVYPQFRIPSQTEKYVFTLPADVGVYDYLKSRGDQTLYQLSFSEPGQEIVLHWHRLDKTNLTPTIELYTPDWIPLQQYVVGRRKAWKQHYKLPQSHSQLLIRVADQVGYIDETAISYLSLHYLLRVEAKVAEPTYLIEDIAE